MVSRVSYAPAQFAVVQQKQRTGVGEGAHQQECHMAMDPISLRLEVGSDGKYKGVVIMTKFHYNSCI